jgi:hypothetical protein
MAVLCLILTACGSNSAIPQTTRPTAEVVPGSLDGFWLLAGTDFTIDIDLGTAAVDGRTGCARLLGSLTFESSGERTSFSLPGRDDSRCSNTERALVDDIVDLLQAVQRSIPEPGAYVLFDAEGTELGRLDVGG